MLDLGDTAMDPKEHSLGLRKLLITQLIKVIMMRTTHFLDYGQCILLLGALLLNASRFEFLIYSSISETQLDSEHAAKPHYSCPDSSKPHYYCPDPSW